MFNKESHDINMTALFRIKKASLKKKFTQKLCHSEVIIIITHETFKNKLSLMSLTSDL